MKNYIHARLGEEDQKILKELKKVTGKADSSLVKEGLRLIYSEKIKKAKSAFDLVADSAGKFSGGPSDLSTHKKYLQGYGK